MSKMNGKFFYIGHKPGYFIMHFGQLVDNIPGGLFFKSLISSKIVFIPFGAIKVLYEVSLREIENHDEFMHSLKDEEKELLRANFTSNF